MVANNDTFIFNSGLGAAPDAESAHVILPQTFFHDTLAGQLQPSFQSINDGHNTFISPDHHAHITQVGAPAYDPHANDFIIR